MTTNAALINTPPELNRSRYQRWMQRLDLAGQLVGLRVNLRGHTENLAAGDIFLFNHFTRFETAIPPYLIFKHTGAICRSVAHHSLFTAHPWLNRTLLGAGAVPSNLPNLLAFLAKEILRGRKIVIFPEGGLIKDKRVFDSHGDYAVFSSTEGAFRKHHRGAAVLATFLDILKLHLRHVLRQNDPALVQHWLVHLGVASREALHAAVHKPTTLVPSTITFFPIRSEHNSLTKLLGSTFGELNDLLADEIATESNLLFRTTDMDITVRELISTEITQQRAGQRLWQHGLRHARSVEDIFNLNFGSANWLKPVMEHRAALAVARLRDRSVRALYSGLTVNLHHVIAQVVQQFQAQQMLHVPVAQFHQAIFWACYRLQHQAQANPQLMLHSSVAQAATGLDALLGRGHRFQRFLQMLRQAHLVKLKGEGSSAAYFLSRRLDDEVSQDDIRLEHPVHLHVNEAAPQPAVRLAAVWGCQQAAQASAAQLSQAIFSRLVLAAQQAHQGSKPIPFKHAQPYLLQPKHPSGHGVLLIHGLSETPAYQRGIANELQALGHTVLAITLPGHGTTPAKLIGVTAEDWLAQAELGLQVLQGLCSQVSVLGFSTGALVGLRLAQAHPGAIQRVLAAAPPMALVSPLRHLLYPAMALNKLVSWLPFASRFLPHGLIPWYTTGSDDPTRSYPRVPLSAIAQLNKLAKQVANGAAQLQVPTLILQGSADTTVQPAASAALAKALGQGQFQLLPGQPHQIVARNVGHSWCYIHNFLSTGKGSHHA